MSFYNNKHFYVLYVFLFALLKRNPTEMRKQQREEYLFSESENADQHFSTV